MKIRTLTDKAEENLGILKLEETMDKLGISITGKYLILVIDGKEYNIGRDSDVFPRLVDEPFWRHV